MGLFDFIKKDKKKKKKKELDKDNLNEDNLNEDNLNKKNSNQKNKKNNEKNKNKENKENKEKEKTKIFKKLSLNRNKDNEIIDFNSIKKISPEDIIIAKEKRLKNDSRSKEDIIKDEAYFKIAKSHNNRNNRIAAVMELTSQDVLEDLAMDNKDRYVRTIATSRITDPNILEELAHNAKYTDVRQLAYDKLGKEDYVFNEIAQFDKKGKNRLAAVREIEDELVLMDICINAKDQKVRLNAIERVENNQILAEILKNTSDKKIINIIINKENFNNQEILSNICLDSTYDKFIRVEALNKLDSDNEIIKEIAFNEENEHVKLAAIEKLEESEDIIDLALNSSDSSSRLKATEKIDKLNKKPTISTREGRYLALLQNTSKLALMARGALFNITPLKDVLFSKFVRKTCKLDKPCDAITNTFRKLSFATVKNSYKQAENDMAVMVRVFDSTNKKIASNQTSSNIVASPTLATKMEDNLSKIKTSYAESFSEPVLEQRNEALISRFDGLDRKTYDNIYGKIKTFVSDVDEWTTFVPERLVAKDKAVIMENLADKKRVITNNPQDNYNALSEIITKLVHLINPNSEESINLVKNLKKLSSVYLNLNGENEEITRQELIKLMNQQLKDANKLAGGKHYTNLESKKIILLLRQVGKVLNTDKKGLIEQQLTMYKQILPEEEYRNVKKVADKAIKSLNKAIYREGFEYTDKARDLAVGSALTDVAIGMALPVGTTAVAMASADTKQKKRSVALKYGLPLMAGIATSTISTMRLISGGKALMLGATVSILGNELFERLDNYLIKRDAKKTQC